jgi:predicted alternative tryptophan synthase beta-subunit
MIPSDWYNIVPDLPDLVIGCTGGGSNFAGLAFPFLREKPAGRIETVFWAVEPVRIDQVLSELPT